MVQLLRPSLALAAESAGGLRSGLHLEYADQAGGEQLLEDQSHPGPMQGLPHEAPQQRCRGCAYLPVLVLLPATCFRAATATYAGCGVDEVIAEHCSRAGGKAEPDTFWKHDRATYVSHAPGLRTIIMEAMLPLMLDTWALLEHKDWYQGGHFHEQAYGRVCKAL